MEECLRPLKGDGAYDYNEKSTADFINKGSFGMVFRCIRVHDQQKFAIKILKDPLYTLSEDELHNSFEEIKLMKEFPHPFIVKIIDDFIDSR